MGSFAEAMENITQHIHAASEARSARLGELRAETKGFLGEFRSTHRQMATELKRVAEELKEKLDSEKKARVKATQGFMRHTQDFIRSVGVRVSEMRSDTHNLLQRFGLEHRDMERTLRSTLASQVKARIEETRQEAKECQTTMKELRAKLRVDGQNLLENLHRADDVRKQVLQQIRGELAADLREAGRIWREEVKKKGAPSIENVEVETGEAIEETAEERAPVEERAHEVPLEETVGGMTVEQAEAARVSPEADRVLAVIQTHPDGIRLVEIGNELGTDWRGLIGVVKTLMDEDKVEKIDNVYYPAQRSREGEL
ncbi:MAG: hypothetical protein HY731_02915 [Candidatus Tectomicrobia bacterium]|nr:hypothetical protein [Candidatus Tectomicrobia bacterium]